MYKVHNLYTGYARLGEDGYMEANATSTLVVGHHFKVVVDTLTPWDKHIIIDKLKEHNLTPDDITHLVCTHGHPDHVGNNNLFTSAQQHIVGYSVHTRDKFYLHPFECGENLKIDGENLYVMPSPGHTMDSVSLVVKTSDGVVVIAGDTFENFQDLEDDKIWIDAGTENESVQRESRRKILQLGDIVVPGHGPAFPVPIKYKQ